MRRMVLVASDASVEVLTKMYMDAEIVGLDEGIMLARSAGAKLTLAISSFKNVSLEELLTFLPKEKIMKYQAESEKTDLPKIIDFLFAQGAEEVVVLSSLAGSLVHIHTLLCLLKEAHGTLILQDQTNSIQYYGEGTHVIAKQGYDSFTIFGFPEAEVSLEHVSKPIRNMRVSFSEADSLDNKILERVAVLKVLNGGVLLALKKDE
jgi:thiamine pyrophosphokinase